MIAELRTHMDCRKYLRELLWGLDAMLARPQPFNMLM